MTKPTILVVDDEEDIRELVSLNLKREGYEIRAVETGEQALAEARGRGPALIVLDLMLPGIDGLEVCRQLRSNSRTKNIRILMLTAKSEETDEIVGFEMGADDYVTKPFKMKPLIHRIKAFLRRPSASPAESDTVAIGGIEVDRTHHTARVDERELQLTPTEFRLLWTLARQPGRTYTRAELMETSRGEDANAMERTIDVHIRSLRGKLGDRAPVIDTVRGVGFVATENQP